MPITLPNTEDFLAKKFEDRLRARLSTIFDMAFSEALVYGLNYAYSELYREAFQMYDHFIDQYYSYVTKSYYRHGVGIGTGTGENLYRGSQIKLITGQNPDLIIEFSGADMAGYKYDSTDTVLGIVMKGGRGIPGRKGFSMWGGSYSGKYFSVGDTTPDRAFTLFINYLPDMEKELCVPQLKEQFKILWQKYCT